MKKYSRPNAEFIDLSNMNIVTASGCSPYNCPNMYGTTCSHHCYGDSSYDPNCPDDE